MKIVIITDLKKRNEKRFSLILTETNAAENVPPFFYNQAMFLFFIFDLFHFYSKSDRSLFAKRE